MLSMVVVGLYHPVTAAAFGGIWVVGRVIYGIGYASSGPNGRYLGGLITHFGDIPLAIMSMRIAYTTIMKSRL
jgi:glutathione S-transferase